MRKIFTCLCVGFFFLSPLYSELNEWSGKEYSKHSSVQMEQAQEMIKRLDLKGGEWILDVGCGDGKISALLAEKVPKGMVIGIDPSPSMLEQAHKVKLAYPFANLQFESGRAETFLYPHAFDVIVSLYVMHWIPDHLKALTNIRSHLAEGGKAYFVIATPKDDLPLGRALKRITEEWKTYFADFKTNQVFYDLEGYKNLFKKAGLQIEELRYTCHRTYHKNIQEWGNWIAQWLPHVKFLAPSDREAFIHRLQQLYIEESGQMRPSRAPILYTEYALIIEASRF